MPRVSVSGILSALAGLALLVYVVARVGVAEIAVDIRSVGWGLLAVIAIGGLRFLLRAIAWRLCLEPPHTLSLWRAFSAVICGDTIGNLTPLGPLVGEPAKAALVRKNVPLGPAVTALAIENVLYTLSAAAMIAAGMIALLLRFQLPSAIRGIGEVSIAATIVLFAAAFGLLWWQPALVSRALGVAPGLARHADRVRTLEAEVYSFASRHRRAMPGLAAAEVGFHALGVAEAYLTLWLINGGLMNGTPPSWLTAFILETTNRLITVVFKFVPLRLGVDEAATAFLTQQILGLGAHPGLSTAIVRKVRMLFWAIAGGLVLVRDGLGPGTLRASPPLQKSQSGPRDRLTG
jgi:Lysylphosphatidylglycerol synthase TM region